MSDTARLTAELETAIVRQLLAAWRDLNACHFRAALSPPTIELSDTDERLGRWVHDLRCIEISRRLAWERPWGVVVEVLKHEMAHQYVHEILREEGETAHGPAFQRVCQRLGIDATAAGMPEAQTATEDTGRVLGRIARLLALAESPNQNEAELAMSEAQRLMLKYNIEVAPGQKSGYGFRHLGAVTGRASEADRLVGMILGAHFFVQAIWVSSYLPQEDRKGRVLEVCGTLPNLEMAEYVYTFLHRTGEALWQAHKRARGIRGDKDRRTFIAGVMLGFAEKLKVQGRQHLKEGLVWLGDAEGLKGYLRQRHPYIRHTSHQGQARNEAHHEGRAAGRQIVLSRPVEGPAGPGGRALPGR